MKKVKKRKLKSGVILIILTVFAVILSIVTIKIVKYNSQYELLGSVTYNAHGGLTYSVCLNENEFINGECFSEDRSFVTSLIKNIKLNASYILQTSIPVEFTYSYKIIANVLVTEKGDASKVLNKKEEVLFESGEINSQGSLININKNIDFDFQKYNSEVVEFKRNYILAVDSNVTIDFVVDLDAQHENVEGGIQNNRSSKISIPLAEQTLSVTKQDNTFNIDNTAINKYKEKDNASFVRILFYVALGFDALIIGAFVLVILSIIPRRSKYDAKLKKILKEYDRAIVKTKSLPNLSKTKMIDVETFEELLDVRDNLEKPIIFCENLSRTEAIFIILNNNETYRYILNSYDVGDKK